MEHRAYRVYFSVEKINMAKMPSFRRGVHCLHAVGILIALGVLFILSSAHPYKAKAETTAPATTVIASNIVTNTIWTLAGSPYSLTVGVTVLPGVTLTIEPGVEVQASQSAELRVNGRLLAIGTASQPITFTSTSGQAGAWYGISMNGT